MLQERFYERDGVRLNYAEGPDNGPSLLLLPAYDNRWQSYSSIIPGLASKTHLYILDTRGRGRSDRTPGEYELIHSLKDSIGFIEEVIYGPCHIIGHSSGGWIGMWLASTRPTHVSSLIVGDSVEADMYGARDSGITGVWIKTPDQPVWNGHAIASICDLPAFLKVLDGESS